MSTSLPIRAAVLGTGMMGPGIAVSLALGGCEAVLASRTEEGAARGLAAARGQLDVLEANGLAEPGAAAEARARLSAAAELEAACAGAAVVVESVPEDLELKQALFARLEELAPEEALLASNTSGLSITAIAARCRRPERVLTAHFWNPPHLMPLVELVRGEKTSAGALERMRELLVRCGKRPVTVKKDRPGQLGNRLQMALFREAVHIVQEGIAEPEDVDTAARLGFGIRLPVYGILEHIDMVGLPLARAVCDYTARDLNSEPRAPELFERKIAAGETGAAAGKGFYDWSRRDPAEVRARRDAFLIECLKRGVHRRES
jgi:3-hydroxybutyryl-CoA dehydrogenase